MLFNRDNLPQPPLKLDLVVAQEIYALFAQGMDETQIHTRGHHPRHISVVRGEYKRLELEAIQAMQADEVPKTADTLKAELHSDLLDIDKVVNDVQVYYPNYDPSRTWQSFFEVFVPPKVEPVGEGLGEEGI